jgi:hypothetical protein
MSPSNQVPIPFTVVSPLAEGADRLVAREALRLEGAELEAVLPLSRAEYMKDFETAESKGEFTRLEAQARKIVELSSAEAREESYERVGRYVVDHCDVLIAIWDGQESRGQGGTAEIVDYARTRLKHPHSSNDSTRPGPVAIIIISALPPYDLREEFATGINVSASRKKQ